MKQQFARFHFETKDGTPLIITYLLQPNSLVPRWIDFIKRRQGDAIELKISNKSKADLPELMSTLNGIISNINSYYDRPLPLYTSVEEINRETLNHLHEEFEVYGERHQEVYPAGVPPKIPEGSRADVWPGLEFKPEFHQIWMKLNQYIHIAESAMNNDEFPQYSCLVQYMPFEYGERLREEDKLFLDSNFKWGNLYLGYNTLGKDWNDACMDNDQRLIWNKQIKVQESFCSEAWLNFNAESEMPRTTEMEFWNWYSNLSVELKQQIPINRLNELALGRYYLGQIVIDETFLSYNPDFDAWRLPNSDARKKWNLEVFSTITACTGIEIV